MFVDDFSYVVNWILKMTTKSNCVKNSFCNLIYKKIQFHNLKTYYLEKEDNFS